MTWLHPGDWRGHVSLHLGSEPRQRSENHRKRDDTTQFRFHHFDPLSPSPALDIPVFAYQGAWIEIALPMYSMVLSGLRYPCKPRAVPCRYPNNIDPNARWHLGVGAFPVSNRQGSGGFRPAEWDGRARAFLIVIAVAGSW